MHEASSESKEDEQEAHRHVTVAGVKIRVLGAFFVGFVDRRIFDLTKSCDRGHRDLRRLPREFFLISEGL